MTLLLRTRRLSDELYALFNGHHTPSAKRQFLSAGAHDAVHEHHRAIGHLVSEGLCGSALALRRSMFDGCLRGLWLAHVATDEQIDRFADETYDPKPERVLKLLKYKGVNGAEILRQFYDTGWSVMSSYVHGGFRQVVGRLGTGFVGADYAVDEIDSLLQHANWFALLSAVELAQIANNEPLLNAVVAIGERYAEKWV